MGALFIVQIPNPNGGSRASGPVRGLRWKPKQGRPCDNGAPQAYLTAGGARTEGKDGSQERAVVTMGTNNVVKLQAEPVWVLKKKKEKQMIYIYFLNLIN